MTEYRIEYTIQRMLPDEDDFTEIGFGSSGACRALEDAVYSVESYVGNGQWETEPDHPDPSDVMAELSSERSLR